MFDHFQLADAVLVGCSRGGQHSLDFALSDPDRVKALIWVCGGVSGNQHQGSPEQSAVFNRVEELWRAGKVDELVELETHVWADGPLAPEGRAPQAFREHIRRMIHAIETRQGPEPTALPAARPAAGRLHELNCPVLVVIGAHDTSGTIASADLLSTAVAHAERLDFPDSAHVPSLEHPDRFNTAVRAFLARHSQPS